MLLGGKGVKFDVDGLSETQAKDLVKNLLGENMQLKFSNNTLISELEKFGKENSDLNEKISFLHSKATSDHLIVEQNEELKRNIELLQNENEQLKHENAMLKAKLAEFESRISQLEARDKPITVREAMRILEHCICFEAVKKSKRKFRDGNYNFAAIAANGDEDTKNALKTAQQNCGITANHIKTMNFLKDCGDFSAHSDRPFLTKKEWSELLLGDDDEDESSFDDSEEAKVKTDLLSALEKFFPTPVDGDVPWQIVDYTEAKKKVPVLKVVRK
jgi:regulator of replication initiation timing